VWSVQKELKQQELPEEHYRQPLDVGTVSAVETDEEGQKVSGQGTVPDYYYELPRQLEH
jgi:hypothetical protein